MNKIPYTNVLLVRKDINSYNCGLNDIEKRYDKLGNVTVQANFDVPFPGTPQQSINSVCAYLTSVLPNNEMKVFFTGGIVETSSQHTEKGEETVEVVFQTEMREK